MLFYYLTVITNSILNSQNLFNQKNNKASNEGYKTRDIQALQRHGS